MGRGTQLLPIFGGYPRQFSPAGITSAISRAGPRDPLAQSYIPPNRCFCVVYVCCSAMPLVVWYCTWGGIRCRATRMRARVDSHDVVRVLVLALAGCEKKKKFPTVLSVHFAPHRCREELRARLCERVPIMALMSSSYSTPECTFLPAPVLRLEGSRSELLSGTAAFVGSGSACADGCLALL